MAVNVEAVVRVHSTAEDKVEVALREDTYTDQEMLDHIKKINQALPPKRRKTRKELDAMAVLTMTVITLPQFKQYPVTLINPPYDKNVQVVQFTPESPAELKAIFNDGHVRVKVHTFAGKYVRHYLKVAPKPKEKPKK